MREGTFATSDHARASGGERLTLRAYLDECRNQATEEMVRLFGDSDQHGRVLYDLILDYPLRDGKALRPTLAIATCRAMGGYRQAVLPTAATLELYHNAFLIHDDIEDDSLMRRGQPTLHVDHGVPIAVNVGDAMLVLSLKPLLDNVEVLGLGPALRILELVAQMSQESVEGQAIELDWVRHSRWDLTDRDYVDMVIQKTGWYSFIAPIHVGAIAAHATKAQLEQLTKFAIPLSVAFQIADDLLNLEATPEAYGKEIGGDLWEGKRTLILLHAVRTASVADAERAKAILSKPRPSSVNGSSAASVLDRLIESGHVASEVAEAFGFDPVQHVREPAKTDDDIAWLFELIQRQGSLAYATGIAQCFASEAASALDRCDWLQPSVHRDVLADVVAYVHERAR